jgi:hypothetical protein
MKYTIKKFMLNIIENIIDFFKATLIKNITVLSPIAVRNIFKLSPPSMYINIFCNST